MRRRMEPIPTELRDRYYFIDYLRLHRFGKQAGIWKKNRNMLVKEHEYNTDDNITARKGYKSYIQRCMKSILDTMYSDFTVMKPRNRFAYEIGKRATNTRHQDIIELSGDSEEKIKFIIQRYLQTGEYSDLVIPYRDAVAESKFLSFKNNEAGLVVTLDNARSFGYLAIRDLEKVREIQTKMIEAAEDKDKLLGSMLKSGLEKARILPDGSSVQMLDDHGRPTERYGTIRTSNLRTGYNGTELLYSVTSESGGDQNYYPNQFIPVRGERPEAGSQATLTAPSGTLLERIIEYANDNFGQTVGVNSESIFRLSRAAIAREFTNNSDMHSATETRRIEPTSEILSRIHSEHGEELCEECGQETENCHCCGECGCEECQCDDYNDYDDETEEWDDEVA